MSPRAERRATRTVRTALPGALAAVVAISLSAFAGDAARAASPVKVETIVRPDTVLVGQSVELTWRVWLPKGSTLSFPARPPDDSLAHWSAWTVATVPGKHAVDEHRLSAVLQSFALGPVAVPGPPIRFHVPGEGARLGRFPTTGFVVPLTSTRRGFPSHVEIAPDPGNGLEHPSWALVEQLRAVAVERCSAPTGNVGPAVTLQLLDILSMITGMP